MDAECNLPEAKNWIDSKYKYFPDVFISSVFVDFGLRIAI
jgi:hypothetical protein